METSPMETDDCVDENRVEPQVVKLDEIAPVEVCETRAPAPEMEKSSDQHVNMVDVTKLSYEVQQGYRVFVEMSADSYKNVTWPFMEPVDAEALGLWDYHEKIKEPMSFHQIGCKFNKYEYNSITEVIADIRLILENCYRYNGANHWVSKLGHKMEKILEQKLALLNRSLRDKVSLEATMALKSDFISAAVTGEGTGRRRTTPRNSYIKMINGEDSSSLLTHLKIQEDIEERERRRIREKEKKEANLVLLQDLAEWEEKELGADVVKQLHSMWEIPSLAGLLFLLKEFLYIQDLSVTELELGFIYANKSSLLARIFTALLVTPHQRKSLFKKPPMKFRVWESKLCDRMNIWYKAAEKDGQELICHQFGLDMALFEVLGEVNPLVEKSYMDLTLHQRVWILKCLCDNSLVRDYDFREHLATIAPTDQREQLLGNCADNWSYVYFPIFSATDLRIYKQCPLEVPTLSKRKKKVTPPPPPPPAVMKAKVTPARPATPTQSRRNPRLRKLRNTMPSPEPETTTPPTPLPDVNEDPPEPKNTIAEGFELVAYDVDTLKKLCEKFDEPPPPPKKRGRKPKPPPPRKRCEVDLHQTLLALLEELEKYEMSFSKLLSKAKIKIMKESQEPEPEDEPEEVVPAEEGEEWGSEESIGDEIEDAGARNMSSDEDFVLEDEEGRTSKTPVEIKKDNEQGENQENEGTLVLLPQKRKAEDTNAAEETKQLAASAHVSNNDNPCSISIQTAPLKLKKKRKQSMPVADVKTTSVSASQTISTAVPQVSFISHIPSGLQKVKETGAVSVAASTAASCVNSTAVASSCTKTLASGRIVVVGSQSSTNITQANTASVRVHPKLPVILNKSNLSTGVKPSSSVTPPTSCSQSTASAHTSTASKNLSSTPITVASPSLQSQAHLATTVPGVGKVMFVTSSGVPLKVLQAIPVSKQSLVQGKSVSLGNTIASSPLQVVSSSSPHSTSTNVSVPLQVLKALPVLQQSLVKGKTLKTAPVESNSNSTTLSVVSSSSLSTPAQVTVPSQVLKATPVSQQPLVQGKTLNTALPGSSSASSSVCIVSPSSLSGTGGTVPMQVLKAVPVLQQPLVQGKTLHAAAFVSSSESSPAHLVPSTSSPSTPKGAVLASSSLPAKATTCVSQMPSSPIRKVVISGAPTDVASVLSTAKQVMHVATTSASSLKPPVVFVQHTGTGGVIPLTVKGGAVVMPTPSASQQVVIMTPPNVLTSSATANTATVVSGTSISVLGNKQTSLTQKVILSPSTSATGQRMPQLKPKAASVVSSNKPFVQVAPSPIEMKTSQAKTKTVPLDSKPVILTTVAALPTAKATATTVSMGSNSTALITTVAANSNAMCTSLAAGNEQVEVKGTLSSEVTTPNKQPTNLESNHICSTEVPQSSTKTLTPMSDTTDVTADTQIVSVLSQDTNLKHTNLTKCDMHLSSKTIPLDKSCESEKQAGNGIVNKFSEGLNEKDEDSRSCSELSMDLTCYETSVSDSAGCEESDDAMPNGLHLSDKKSPPSIVTEYDEKLCNGVACPETQTNRSDENTFDSVEQNHATEANQTSDEVSVPDV